MWLALVWHFRAWIQHVCCAVLLVLAHTHTHTSAGWMREFDGFSTLKTNNHFGRKFTFSPCKLCLVVCASSAFFREFSPKINFIFCQPLSLCLSRVSVCFVHKCCGVELSNVWNDISDIKYFDSFAVVHMHTFHHIEQRNNRLRIGRRIPRSHHANE